MIVRRIDSGASRSQNTAREAREAMAPRRPARRVSSAEGVQTGADRRNRNRIVLVNLKIRLDGSGALNEQGHGWILGQCFYVGNRFGIRQRERRHGILMFAVDVQRSTTGYQQFEPGGAGEQLRH